VKSVFTLDSMPIVPMHGIFAFVQHSSYKKQKQQRFNTLYT